MEVKIFLSQAFVMLLSFRCVAPLYVQSGSQQDRKSESCLKLNISLLTCRLSDLADLYSTVQVSDTTNDAISTTVG